MQDKESIPNNNLSEILGFDPVTGVRVEDKNNLRPIKKTQLSIPIESQEAFVNFIAESRLKSHSETTYKVIAEQLLCITQSSTNIERDYYAWNTIQDDNFKFHLVARARISNIHLGNPNGFLFNIRQVGESRLLGGDHLVIFLGGEHISCGFYLGGRDDMRGLQVGFDKNRLGHVGLSCHREKSPNLSDTDNVDFNIDEELEKQLKHESIRISKGLNTFELANKGVRFILRRLENQQLKDEITGPQEVDETEFIQKLFDPVTIKNPFNAAPNLDESWRFANLMEIVGVKWERH